MKTASHGSIISQITQIHLIINRTIFSFEMIYTDCCLGKVKYLFYLYGKKLSHNLTD